MCILQVLKGLRLCDCVRSEVRFVSDAAKKCVARVSELRRVAFFPALNHRPIQVQETE